MKSGTTAWRKKAGKWVRYYLPTPSPKLRYNSETRDDQNVRIPFRYNDRAAYRREVLMQRRAK